MVCDESGVDGEEYRRKVANGREERCGCDRSLVNVWSLQLDLQGIPLGSACAYFNRSK